MASTFHNRAKTKFLEGNLSWLSGTFKVMLATAAYVVDPDHDFLSSASAAELSGTGYQEGFSGTGRKTLGNKTVTQRNQEDRGVALADPLTWNGILAGTAAWAIVYQPGTSDADSMIIATIDIPDVATNGTALALNWAALADGGILAL